MLRDKLNRKAITLLTVATLWAVAGGIGVAMYTGFGSPTTATAQNNPCNPCNPCGGGMAAGAVDLKVVLEYPSKMPGVAKVQLVRLIMQPGAAIENMNIEWEGYCQGTKGVFTIINHTQGTTGVYAAGGRWNDVLGDVVSIYNYGDVPAEQWIYMLHKK